MTGAEIAGLVSLGGNILLALFGAWQKSKTSDAESKLTTVSEALTYIEKAINDNKLIIERTGAGDVITKTIASYGEAAKTSVDVARLLAKAVNEQIAQARKDAYVANIVDAEAKARAERVAKLAKEDSEIEIQ